MKKFISILVLACVGLVSFGAEMENSPLVLQDLRGNSHVVPWFRNIQPDLLHLIRRSYWLTKRSSENNFLRENQMLNGNDHLKIKETGHQWFCDRNFTGIHGKIEGTSWIRTALNYFMECLTCGNFQAELDFPGFVALKQPTDDCEYYVISVVFRGSQSEDFQPKSGMLGASWATNYDALPLAVDPLAYGFEGTMHSGYLTKMNYCNASRDDLLEMVDQGEINNPLKTISNLNFINPLDESIGRIISTIPEEERFKIRFVVTGHSQGAGLAQIGLPHMIRHFGKEIPGFVDNISTPRFFGYFLSAPHVAAGQETVNNYANFVGYDNMITHAAFRDIVTIASLPNYMILGHFACDSAYDTIYRGICSEIAYNNRLFLLNFFKNCLDRDSFDRDDANHWRYREDPDLVICWREIKNILNYIDFSYDGIGKDGIVQILNLGLDCYHKRNKMPETDHFFREDQVPFKNQMDWEKIRDICRGDLHPSEIRLDGDRCAIIHRIVENIHGDTVTFSSDGTFNISSLIDTVLDLMDAEHGSENPGGFREYLRRIFCCSCCWGEEPKASSSFIFDPNFRELLATNGIHPEDYGITPAGRVSLIAYLHYGSKSFESTLFDEFLPSRNLDFALKNGKIAMNDAHPLLHSEIGDPMAENNADENIVSLRRVSDSSAHKGIIHSKISTIHFPLNLYHEGIE
ncbi:MAG: hypothetical protein LBI77_01240 [Puniceicoccales bacterium]|nr:hypothetical protein [Puniceicoccales bacterium]